MIKWFIGWSISLTAGVLTQDIMFEKWVFTLLKNTMTKMDWLKYIAATISTIIASIGVYRVGLWFTNKITREEMN